MTFVHAISVHAIFFHATFVQGQNWVVYKCNQSCLDQTIKFQTSYRATPKLGQLQLILSLATTQFCPWTNVVWKNIAWTDIAWTNVARTYVAWANVAW